MRVSLQQARHPPRRRSIRPCPRLHPPCLEAARDAASIVPWLRRERASPHVVKSSLSAATYHAQACGVAMSAEKARDFRLAPQRRWTRATAYDRRPVSARARDARALAVAAHLLRERARTADTLSPSTHTDHHFLCAITGNCDASSAALGASPSPSALSWLRRCHTAATHLLLAAHINDA